MIDHMIGRLVTWSGRQAYLGDGGKAVVQSEVVGASASGGISEGRERMNEGWAQQTQHLLWSPTLVDDLWGKRGRERERGEITLGNLIQLFASYHVATDEIGSIGSFATVKTGVVDDLLGSLRCDSLHKRVCVCVCEKEIVFMTVIVIKHHAS